MVIEDLGAGAFHQECFYEFAEDGEFQLHLCDQEAASPCYWLGEASVIRYDTESAMLIVSGEGYVGEKALRHLLG